MDVALNSIHDLLRENGGASAELNITLSRIQGNIQRAMVDGQMSTAFSFRKLTDVYAQAENIGLGEFRMDEFIKDEKAPEGLLAAIEASGFQIWKPYNESALDTLNRQFESDSFYEELQFKLRTGKLKKPQISAIHNRSQEIRLIFEENFPKDTPTEQNILAALKKRYQDINIESSLSGWVPVSTLGLDVPVEMVIKLNHSVDAILDKRLISYLLDLGPAKIVLMKEDWLKYPLQNAVFDFRSSQEVVLSGTIRIDPERVFTRKNNSESYPITLGVSFPESNKREIMWKTHYSPEGSPLTRLTALGLEDQIRQVADSVVSTTREDGGEKLAPDQLSQLVTNSLREFTEGVVRRESLILEEHTPDIKKPAQGFYLWYMEATQVLGQTAANTKSSVNLQMEGSLGTSAKRPEEDNLTRRVTEIFMTMINRMFPDAKLSFDEGTASVFSDDGTHHMSVTTIYRTEYLLFGPEMVNWLAKSLVELQEKINITTLLRRDSETGSINGVNIENLIIALYQQHLKNQANSYDSSMSSVFEQKGGIDLNPVDQTLRVKADSALRFQIDPAMLEEYRAATGFTPVIMNMMPFVDLRTFLGLNDDVPSAEPNGIVPSRV
jgi:hypothetical protein